MKRPHIYTGTKRSMVYNILNNGMAVEEAVRLTRARPETVKKWLNKYGSEVLKGASDGNTECSLAQ